MPIGHGNMQPESRKTAGSDVTGWATEAGEFYSSAVICELNLRHQRSENELQIRIGITT